MKPKALGLCCLMTSFCWTGIAEAAIIRTYGSGQVTLEAFGGSTGHYFLNVFEPVNSADGYARYDSVAGDGNQYDFKTIVTFDLPDGSDSAVRIGVAGMGQDGFATARVLHGHQREDIITDPEHEGYLVAYAYGAFFDLSGFVAPGDAIDIDMNVSYYFYSQRYDFPRLVESFTEPGSFERRYSQYALLPIDPIPTGSGFPIYPTYGFASIHGNFSYRVRKGGISAEESWIQVNDPLIEVHSIQFNPVPEPTSFVVTALALLSGLGPIGLRKMVSAQVAGGPPEHAND